MAAAAAAATTTTKVLLTDLASSVNRVPSNYIRPISDRPNLSDVQSSDASIPFIDLQGLHGPNHSNIIKQIGQACQQYGFFQIKNHGIPETLISTIMNIQREFFRLPESERMKSYSDDPNWRDFLRLHCYPLEDYVNEGPSNPPSFREDVAEYCTSVRGLVLRLLEAISESLGLERDCIEKALGKQGQHMALNYYPPCPQPELTYGLPGHTDPNLITVLLQDDVPGLQVLRNGKWIAVNPIPNTFIVNIGDQMQVLSKDQYKSMNHVPSNYIRPISDQPNLSDVQSSDATIRLHGPNHSNIIKQIGKDCQQDGFFQVKNHGIPDGSDTVDQLHAPKSAVKHRNDLNNAMVAFCFASCMAIAVLPIEVHSQLHSSLLWLALAVLLGFTSLFLSEFIDSRFGVTVQVLQKFGQFFTVTAFYMAISLRFPFYFKCTSLAVCFISFLTIFITNFFYRASSVNRVPSNNILPISISNRPNLSDVQRC